MTTQEKTKQCSKCKQDKPVSEFYKDGKSPDGIGYWCKACSKDASQGAKKKKLTGGAGACDPVNQGREETREEKVKAALGVLFANHGDLFENIRQQAIDQFRSPDMQVLFLLDSSVNGGPAARKA